MTTNPSRTRARLAAAACALALIAAAQAQTPGIKRTILQRTDIGDREVVLGMAEIAPGGSTGRHTHPGIETGYVLEGSTVLVIDGEAPRVLKAGDSFTIPMGKVHDAKVVGDKPLKVLVTYVVEKGKPLATPAP